VDQIRSQIFQKTFHQDPGEGQRVQWKFYNC
jgi:hypothetical protein